MIEDIFDIGVGKIERDGLQSAFSFSNKCVL
jgi:hypothetical protein